VQLSGAQKVDGAQVVPSEINHNHPDIVLVLRSHDCLYHGDSRLLEVVHWAFLPEKRRQILQLEAMPIVPVPAAALEIRHVSLAGRS
jgi:hypothetical protein